MHARVLVIRERCRTTDKGSLVCGAVAEFKYALALDTNRTRSIHEGLRTSSRSDGLLVAMPLVLASRCLLLTLLGATAAPTEDAAGVTPMEFNAFDASSINSNSNIATSTLALSKETDGYSAASLVPVFVLLIVFALLIAGCVVICQRVRNRHKERHRFGHHSSALLLASDCSRGRRKADCESDCFVSATAPATDIRRPSQARGVVSFADENANTKGDYTPIKGKVDDDSFSKSEVEQISSLSPVPSNKAGCDDGEITVNILSDSGRVFFVKRRHEAQLIQFPYRKKPINAIAFPNADLAWQSYTSLQVKDSAKFRVALLERDDTVHSADGRNFKVAYVGSLGSAKTLSESGTVLLARSSGGSARRKTALQRARRRRTMSSGGGSSDCSSTSANYPYRADIITQSACSLPACSDESRERLDGSSPLQLIGERPPLAEETVVSTLPVCPQIADGASASPPPGQQEDSPRGTAASSLSSDRELSDRSIVLARKGAADSAVDAETSVLDSVSAGVFTSEHSR